MWKTSILCSVALLLVTSPGLSRQARAEVGKATVDPRAVAALDAMGAFLRSQKVMKVTAEMTTDDVLDSGQKVQISSVAQLEVRRPDRLRADVVSDRKNEQLFYDGTTFTVFQPSTNYYASFKAPPTLAELVDVAEQRYGLDLPLADLFYWGTGKSQVGSFQSATRIGTSTVRGVKCDHYAFRQADVDWEICIEQGSTPVPRKLVVTTTTEPAQPQHVAVLNWDFVPDLDENTFHFAPPSTAHRIEFETAHGSTP